MPYNAHIFHFVNFYLIPMYYEQHIPALQGTSVPLSLHCNLPLTSGSSEYIL